MSIARNTVYNLVGSATPLVVALATVPLYLHQIGEARYGVLAIAWLLLGYFGVFDLGLSRATANHIARLPARLASDREAVFWTACLLNAGFGLLGGLALYFVGGQLLGQWFKMSAGLHAEALEALPWIAASVPVATLTSVLTGALEGQEHFGLVNVIQSAGTLLFQVVPLAAAVAISPSLAVVIPVAVGVRAVTSIPLALAVRATLPVRHRPRLHVARMRQLLGYGAWVTVTNIVGPILVSVDRFLIGVVMGAAAVAYYVVPFNLANRTSILPSALSRTLFPRVSAQSKPAAERLAIDSVQMLGAIMTPLLIFGLLVVHPFLALWVGGHFATRAAPVAEILLLGVWVNGFAVVPYMMLQAQGRPDLVAKFHVVELAPFIALLWWALHRFGLSGAAGSWTFRVVADAVLLFWASGLGRSALTTLWPGAILILSAGFSVLFLPYSLILERIAVGMSLFALACLWSFRSSARLREMLAKALRFIGFRGICIHDR